jgi:ATP adenylyltransferase
MSAPENSSPSSAGQKTKSAPRRNTNSPYLPTRTEQLLLALYPALLLLGAAFSLASPETRAAPPNPTAGATATFTQDPVLAPSYFARKDNVLNTLFVKRGWAWVTVAAAAWALSHPAAAGRARGLAVRWAAVTGWWFLVTRWFFGPAIVDRGFRLSGGRCEVAEARVEEGGAAVGEVLTAAACKAVGGSWSGGHDISGHVFMLVLGSAFLMQEVGWTVVRWREGQRGSGEERSVVASDGSVQGAEDEAGIISIGNTGGEDDVLGIGGKFVLAIVALSLWMILMTAIYFHTWLEKVSLALRIPRKVHSPAQSC